MLEPRFGTDEDLPRTVRRAREERDRALRQREAQMAGARLPEPVDDRISDLDHQRPSQGSGIVRRLDIPFFHLVRFFLKAVIAAIPALLLLGCLLWVAGKGLQVFFPDLGRMQIFIKFGS